MNGSAAKLTLKTGGHHRRWWSIDRRLRKANAHKIPKEDPSVSPSSPHYLSQTCSALLKRKTFKERAARTQATPRHLQQASKKVTPARSGARLKLNDRPVAIVVTDDLIDEGEAIFSPVKIADPLSSPGSDSASREGVVDSPPPPRARTMRSFSLLKPVPENESLLRSMAAQNSSSVDSVKSDSTSSWSEKSQPQRKPATKSEMIIGHFKEYLGKVKQERPSYVDDIAVTLEELWFTGKLEDLTDLQNAWTVAVMPVKKEVTESSC